MVMHCISIELDESLVTINSTNDSVPSVLIIIIIMSLSSVSLSEDSAGDAPMSREVQTAPLTQQEQSRHRGGVYFGSGHLAKKSVRKRE